MLLLVKKEESASFCHLGITFHEKTSVIITTNRASTEWAQTLNDEELATAIIDRLLYRCEAISLAGTSCWRENRKTIFLSESTVNGGGGDVRRLPQPYELKNKQERMGI